MIDAETIVCASIAKPNRRTKSPIMHNAGFEAAGVNFVYLAFEVDNLPDALAGMRGLGIRGYSVSLPHKVAIIDLLDEVDEVAKRIGAVNTVLNDGGTLRGFNSDWIGAARALEEKTSVCGKNAVVLGAGGAARAVVYALKDRKARRITVVNRTASKAKALAEDFGVEWKELGKISDLPDHDILINATSVGMAPEVNALPIPGDRLKENTVVLDLVFNPLETALLEEAKQRGCVTVPGYRMLLLQGAFQFELFAGVPAPLDAMEDALVRSLR